MISTAFATTLTLGLSALASTIPKGQPRRSPDPELPVPEGTIVDQCTYFHSTYDSFEDCAYIESWWGISHEEFVLWNPSVKQDCSGIQVGFSYCVEVNHGDGISTTQPPPTPTGNPIPSPTLDGTAENCDTFHFAERGDDCESVCSQWGISMDQLMEWNAIVEPDCSGFWAEYYYCVSVEGHTPTNTGATPTETGNSPSPTLDGTAENCDKFHFVEKGDDCESVCNEYGISMEQLMEWNTIVESDCSGFWAQYWYCVSVEGHDSPTTTDGATPTETGNAPSPTLDGTAEDCDEFHFVEKGDDCESVCNEYGISMTQLMKWNTVVESDCSGFWAQYWYCVSVEGHESEPSPTSPPGEPGPTPPADTQPGIIETCETWYVAKKGDTCDSIVASYENLNNALFLRWNPAVGENCGGIWAQYAYCVGTPKRPAVPAEDEDPPPTGCQKDHPKPTQPGALCRCDQWHKMADGEGCWALADKYDVTQKQLRNWNPGNDCSFWVDYFVCVGV